MKKIISVLLAVLMLITLFSGCGKTEEEKTDEFVIVTSFYPMYVMTINVTRDIPGVKVINMTKPQTGCLHDYQMTPGDLKTLEEAQVFIINGAGMESFLSDVLARRKSLMIINASEGIDLISNDEDELNPHVWVSVTNAIMQVRNIGAKLAEMDSKNADKYKQNAEAYIAKLSDLKERMHRKLDGLPNKDIITFHEAFPYFALEFNLNVVAVVEREPGTAPTPQELKQTIEMIKNTKVKALFAEPQYSGSAAQTIANETGVKVYTLDPGVTGDAEEKDYDSYIRIMENNLEVLTQALS